MGFYTKVKCNENLTKSLTARNGLIWRTNLLYLRRFLYGPPNHSIVISPLQIMEKWPSNRLNFKLLPLLLHTLSIFFIYIFLLYPIILLSCLFSQFHSRVLFTLHFYRWPNAFSALYTYKTTYYNRISC